MQIHRLFFISVSSVALFVGSASASIVTSNGSVSILSNVSNMVGVVGTADFDAGPAFDEVLAATYSAQGMTLHSGPLSTILPGVTTTGDASLPYYGSTTTFPGYFPAPTGGGSQAGFIGYFSMVATFSTPVTQVGLTASSNGTQFLTAWDQSGSMIGQVKRTPQSDSGFVGIDTNGVPIAMIAYGNDDLWNGAEYTVGGSTPLWDNVIWASGIRDAAVPEPGAILVWLVLAGAAGKYAAASKFTARKGPRS